MFKNEEGTWEHKCKGTKNYEGQNETIYSVNNCIGTKTNYKSAIDDNSTGKIDEGVKVRGTTNDISTW
jgi:hypothetical protein